MKRRITKRKSGVLLAIILIAFLIAVLDYEYVFPASFGNDPKPVILYYNPLNPLKLTPDRFPGVVSYALENHFNTLMLVVYAYNHYIFNDSTIAYYDQYADSHNLTFVPSYYIVSLADKINVSGFKWVNLDMESISTLQERFFYAEISRLAPLVSVTSPYGRTLLYNAELNIIETYTGVPYFWFEQIWFDHSNAMCSVNAGYIAKQVNYASEFNYCLRYSEGVMVFDYYNLVKSNFSTP